MAKNESLRAAKKAKNDEFYTMYEDIQAELNHYKPHFKGKTVLCNCDDPYESNFSKFFMIHFYDFGLKRLICTSYANSPVCGTGVHLSDTDGETVTSNEHGYVLDITGVPHPNSESPSELDVENFLKTGVVRKLKGNGSFDSEECLEFLKEADIVVTNPPFSRFRDIIALMLKYDKKFLLIGNQNAITYKELFPEIKNNRIWLGPSIHSGDRAFRVPDDYPLEAAGCGTDKQGCKFIRVKGVRWFSNLDHKKRHEPLLLMTMEDNIRFSKHKTLRENGYQKYDNYDAIEVPYTDAIPKDYKGIMGVPITWLDKYCPEQFEIVGCTYSYGRPDFFPENCNMQGSVGGKQLYKRLLIRYTDSWIASHPEDFSVVNS